MSSGSETPGDGDQDVDTGPPALVITDFVELVALDKVLREAKFSDSPNDPVIAASPIVADLARRVRAAHDLRTIGLADRPDREDMIGPTWREWTLSVREARKLTDWHSWDQEAKARVARDLLSPFGVSDERVLQFINEVDSH